ncbi:helix-turn-helix domain-containing protein [Gymnodinialimonas sp.]
MARVQARRVKMHRSYTIQQLADLLEVTVGTVRRWCKRGLYCLTDKRPFLIEGQDFHEFHAEKLARKKTSLQAFEVYCLGCKTAQTPQPGLVDAEPMDAKRDRIMAICPTCERLTRRIIKRSDLRKWSVKYGFAPNMQEYA